MLQPAKLWSLHGVKVKTFGFSALLKTNLLIRLYFQHSKCFEFVENSLGSICLFIKLCTFITLVWVICMCMCELYCYFFIPKISLIILFNVCHIIQRMLVWRIWSWINYKFLFILITCLLVLNWYCKEKFFLDHSCKLKGWSTLKFSILICSQADM